MGRKILKIITWLVGILIGAALIVFIAFQVSPRPSAYLIGRMFNGPVKITDEQSYNQALKNVSVLENEIYPSAHQDNNFDIYYPKAAKGPVPVLIWVHGGGFVGGDKIGGKEFATKLASDTNVAVITMNYQVAPSSQYPNQVKQVEELVKALIAKKYEMLDLEHLLFGGDSAGSQIALQYVTAQTNPAYAKEVGLEADLALGQIKGSISYCGPVDLQQTASISTENKAMKFFVNTVAWSLVGTKKWQDNPKLFEASLVAHVTADFPPTYITDGNAFSFQDQGIALSDRLKELKVPVEDLFYKDQPKEVTHEYQFNYATEEAQAAYKQTVAFVNQYK